MENQELLYLLALQKASGIGDINAKKLMKHCGNAQAVFEEKASNLLKIDGVGTYKLKGLKDKTLLKQAEKEIEFIQKNNIKVSSFLDADYPERLRHGIDSPIVIFQKGNISFKQQRIISIVGTRNITNYGKTFLKQFIADLAQYNPLIVSGLAYGVDIYTHQLALEHNLQTVAVLAHGLDRVYPSRHQKEATKMQENGGLLTDFWSGTTPERNNFVKRNRIVAGISKATIVIESADKGGSLITADIANSYNRDVFALPGRVTDLYSKGCNNLIKTNKAALLQSAKDLAYILNWEQSKPNAIQKQLFVELDDTETLLYNYLLKEGKQALDIIALHCNLPIYRVSSVLLNMELKGVVRPLHGKIFEVI
ncbi:MAG: DNA-processing protein DprA [Flavobacteriaceae bacterium]